MSHANFNPTTYREELVNIPSVSKPADRHMFMLNWLTRLSMDIGCEPPILVGCGAVELYTEAQTATGDADIIAADSGTLGSALHAMGFQRSDEQRFWFHPAHSILLEFPSDKLRTGQESATIRIFGVDCKIISPEDLIVERLESWDASGAGTDLVYAYLVYHLHHENISRGKLTGKIRMADVGGSFEFISELHNDAVHNSLSVDDQGRRISLEIRSRRIS